MALVVDDPGLTSSVQSAMESYRSQQRARMSSLLGDPSVSPLPNNHLEVTPMHIGPHFSANPKPAKYPRRKVVSKKRHFQGNWWQCTLSCGHVEPFPYWKRIDCSAPKTLGCAKCANGRGEL
jgi:hypothetical protein